MGKPYNNFGYWIGQAFKIPILGQFNVSNIVAVLASVVLAGISFVFLWWGVRLAFRSIMSVVKGGKLSINSKRKRGK